MRLVSRGFAVSVTAIAVAVSVFATPLASDAAVRPGQVAGVAKATQDWAGKSVKIKWNNVPSATSYVLKWSTRADLSSPKYKDSSVVSAWMTGVQPAQDYFVAVAAKNGSTAGSWSNTFRTRLQPNAVGTFGTVTAKPASDGVSVSIPEVSDASDYQVRWSAGPNENRTPDRWAPHFTPWSSAFDPATRTWTLKGSGDDLTSVAYGNPIYVRAMARNTFFNSTYVRKSAQVSAWPVPVTPVASDLPVHFASYNVLCSGCEIGGAPGWSTRAPAIASMINAKDPDVLAVVEASGLSGGSGSAQAYLDLDRRLPNLELTDPTPMTVSRSHQGNRILYNPAKYTLLAHGVLTGVKDYGVYPASAAPDTNTPWAKLRSTDGSGTTFYVVAAHYGIPSSSYSEPRKTLLGRNSTQLLSALDSINQPNASGKRLPVVLGGDLNDGRYPEDAVDGAQPTLIRAGFYDASASLHRYGTAKPTYNDYKSPGQQADDPNKDGQRIDYILTQGFRGSDEFVNNWNSGTSVIPSDHNMIEARLHIPLVR